MQEEKVTPRRFRLAWLSPLLVLVALCVGGVASVFAAPLAQSYDYGTGAQGWTGVAAIGDPMCDVGACLGQGNGGTAVSPSLTVDPSSSISGHFFVSYKFTGGSTKPVPAVTVTAGSSGAHTATVTCPGWAAYQSGESQVCNYSVAAGVLTSSDTSVTVSIAASMSGGWVYLDTVTVNSAAGGSGGGSGGGSVGSISYPTLDLASISSNMGAYFAFIAPALWIVAGIGLGGLIVGKVRHLF